MLLISPVELISNQFPPLSWPFNWFNKFTFVNKEKSSVSQNNNGVGVPAFGACSTLTGKVVLLVGQFPKEGVVYVIK